MPPSSKIQIQLKFVSPRRLSPRIVLTRSKLRARVIFNSHAAGFSQSIGLVGNRDDIDYSKCGNTYWGYAYCRKAELLYPNTNEGRQDWSDTGAVEYVK